MALRCYNCNAMPYVPNIRNYKPFYIETASDSGAWDTREYGLIAQTQPYPDNIEMKEPYKNDWLDEHGDDEYVADMYYKSFEFTVKFFIKYIRAVSETPINVINGLKKQFRDKIKNGYFKVYDSWQDVGYRNVRFVSDNVEQRYVSDDSAWMIFSVTFKVDDPATKVAFTGGEIIVIPDS